ncbi:MAG: hypothetical protein JXB23_08905, partial [Candidatus Aminicenantes bacterium]|nr:hypothetical protein [Candidatus Aminicenantes bacterium]
MVNNWIPPLGLGFLATTLQILLIREFSAHFYGNEISFGLVLGSWLLWGGLGSIVAGKIKYSRNRALHLFGMTVSFFLICLLCLRFSRFFLGTLPGEMTGATAILTFSLVLTFFVSLPLGILFVFNVHLYEENLPLVYLLESAGASAAGVVLYFAFIPNLSNWQTAALAGSMVFLLVFLSLGIRKGTWSLIPLVILFAGFFFLDVPLQRISWKPFHLIQSKDSRYGKLQVIRTADQISLYDNNVAVYSYPDPASSEESVHFALLQHPDAKK